MTPPPLDPATLDAVVLDIGGVVLSWANGKYRRSPDDWPPALMDRAWEERLGLPTGEFARRVWTTDLHRQAETGVLPFADYWSAVGAELGIDDRVLGELLDDYWNIMYLDDRVRTSIRALRPRFRVATLSNAWSNAREQMIARHRAEELFEVMVISAEQGYAKPDPRIYHDVLRLLDVAAERTLFLDDYQPNVEAALSQGMQARHCESTDELLTLLSPMVGASERR